MNGPCGSKQDPIKAHQRSKKDHGQDKKIKIFRTYTEKTDSDIEKIKVSVLQTPSDDKNKEKKSQKILLRNATEASKKKAQ